MLRPRRQYRLLQAAFLFALIGVAFFGSYAGMRPHERIAEQAAKRAGHEGNNANEPQTVWGWLVSSPESAAAIILCFITAGLAFVTGGLYVATAKLARDARDASERALEASTEATNLARAEFNATHRPEIIAHSFEVVRERIEDKGYVMGNSICARFAVVNKGTSDAVISDIGGRIIFDEHFRAGVPLPTVGIQGRTLSAGEVLRNIMIPGDPDQSSTADFNAAFPGSSDPHLLCVGLIVYEDIEGRRRETGFCRTFAKGDRWVREDDSEHEYSY